MNGKWCHAEEEHACKGPRYDDKVCQGEDIGRDERIGVRNDYISSGAPLASLQVGLRVADKIMFVSFSVGSSVKRMADKYGLLSLDAATTPAPISKGTANFGQRRRNVDGRRGRFSALSYSREVPYEGARTPWE